MRCTSNGEERVPPSAAAHAQGSKPGGRRDALGRRPRLRPSGARRAGGEAHSTGAPADRLSCAEGGSPSAKLKGAGGQTRRGGRVQRLRTQPVTSGQGHFPRTPYWRGQELVWKGLPTMVVGSSTYRFHPLAGALEIWNSDAENEMQLDAGLSKTRAQSRPFIDRFSGSRRSGEFSTGHPLRKRNVFERCRFAG